MAKTAMHLEQHVLPRVPYRQWVISFPKRIRYFLAHQPRHFSRVLSICMRAIEARLQESIERHDGDRVADLHLWAVGPEVYAAIVSLVTDEPKPAEHYKTLIPRELGVAHVTVEVLRCPGALPKSISMCLVRPSSGSDTRKQSPKPTL